MLLPLDADRLRERGEYQQRVVCSAEEPEPNRTLQFRLKRDIGLELPSFDDLVEERSIDSYLHEVEQAISTCARWRVRRFVTISALSFARQVMYEDLSSARWQRGGGRLSNLVMRSLLLGSPQEPTTSTDNLLRLITASDSTQLAAISDARAGRSLVVKGPPGTGKSQMITNLIGAALADGKTVLFVAEKMAALDVVKKRLDETGVGRFCLALHSTKAKKSDVLDALRMAKNAREDRPPRDKSSVHELEGRRSLIENYSRAMAAPLGRLGVSLRDGVWRELELRQVVAAQISTLHTIEIPHAREIDRQALVNARAALTALEGAISGMGPKPIAPWSFVQRLGPRNNAGALTFALQRWQASLHEACAVLSRIGFDATPLTISQARDLVRQLAEASSLDPSTPVELVGRMSDVAVRRRALDCAQALETYATMAGRAVASCDIARAVPRRKDLRALVAAAVPLGQFLESSTVGALSGWLGGQLVWVRDYMRALDGLQAFGVTLGLPGGWDDSGVRNLLRVSQMIAGIDPEVLSNRLDPWLRDDGELLRISAELSSLENAAARIDGRLSGWRAIESKTLRSHATTLRTSGWFQRVFGRAFRAAKRAYLELSTGRIAPVEEMAALLQAAADYLDDLAAFTNSERNRAVLGPASRGLNSSLRVPLLVNRWAGEVRGVFPGNEPRALWAREVLFRADASLLNQLAAFVANAGQVVLAVAGVRRDDLCTLGTWVHTALEALSAAWEPASAAGVRDHVPVAALGELADVLDDLAQAAARIPSSAEGHTLMGAAWKAEKTDPRVIRAAVEAATALDEIGLPPALHAWLTGNLPEHVAASMNLSQALGEALARDAREREHARSLGVSVSALAGPGVRLGEVIKSIDAALQAPEALSTWLQFLSARDACQETPGVSDYIAGFERANLPWEDWRNLADGFEWCVLRSLQGAALAERPGLKRLTSEALNSARDEIRRLASRVEREHRAEVISRVISRPLPKGRSSGARGDWTETPLLANELAKQKRHIPIRQLMARARDTILTLTPCLMMSPLSVAQFLEDAAFRFDLLVIDEASQLPPEDALGSMLRADQIVVVGDEQQLPPTDFFRRLQDDEPRPDEEDDDLEAESVLDLGIRTLGEPRVLRWHYRSRHPSLISFSNTKFYGNELIVPPSPSGADSMGVQIHHVDGVYASSTNPVEADAIVERAVHLMKENPARSLGLVAINQTQADLIREKLDQRIALEDVDFVERWKNTLEPLFVKNLENVQGDERDVILVSLTYGPNESGRVFQRFGPISGANGHRRLNVLFSRAKHQLVVVTSLRSTDVTVTPGSSRGVATLRDYLAFHTTPAPQRGGARGAPGGPSFLSAQVLDLGYHATIGVGRAPMSLEIAIHHPARPHDCIAGIEVDGGLSSADSRDRDFVRPMVLAGLDWLVVPTWTTDWLYEPAVAQLRLRNALEASCRAAKLRPPPLPSRPTVSVIDVVTPTAQAISSEVVPMRIEVGTRERTLSRLEVKGTRIVVGRARTCQIAIPDEFEDVSATHCEMRWEGERFVLADLGSHHGTYVSGLRVKTQVLAPARTHLIWLGRGALSLRVQYSSGGTVEVGARLSAGHDGIDASALERLTAEERRFLDLLKETLVMKQSEIASALGRPPGRVAGFVRSLRVKLQEQGILLFSDRTLPSGELVISYVRSGVQ